MQCICPFFTRGTTQGQPVEQLLIKIVEIGKKQHFSSFYNSLNRFPLTVLSLLTVVWFQQTYVKHGKGEAIAYRL